MELEHFSHDHKLVLNERYNLDPDEGIFRLCFVCHLPIFCTPYYSCSTGCNNFFIHQRCALFPKQLKHVSGKDLTAIVDDEIQYCEKCHRRCHTLWRSKYTFRPSMLSMDALCVASLELRIMHESHEHELIPMKREDSMICGACGLTHQNENMVGRLILFYWCWWCNFWIHEECTTLSNYILHNKHLDHPLALTYSLPQGGRYSYCCGICSSNITSLGVYFCGTCPYYAHINCATRCSELYKPVPSREIRDQLNYWSGLPMPDEDTSLVAYILDKMTRNQDKKFENINDKHDHPLSLNEKLTFRGRALCNGCIQPINSAPYYSCSQCTDYLLHESCTNLPPTIKHLAHEKHPLDLFTNSNTELDFVCNGCHYSCNGFSYRCCEGCTFKLDVQCAFLPVSITHKAHHNRHVLHLTYKYMCPEKTDCCQVSSFVHWSLYYVCTRCDFEMHGFCAGLPMCVRHKFDKHPLKLITGRVPITNEDNFIKLSTEDENFCEFCEENINEKKWYYGCIECKQAFHVDCIPTVAKTSKIKLQAKLNIPFYLHPHPVTPIRLLNDATRKYRCSWCSFGINNFEDEFAFECLECDFSVHVWCRELPWSRRPSIYSPSCPRLTIL